MKLFLYTFVINCHLLAIVHCEPLLYRSLNVDYTKKENLNKERNDTEVEDDDDGVEFRFYRLNYNKLEPDIDTETQDNKTEFDTILGANISENSDDYIVNTTMQYAHFNSSLFLENDSIEFHKNNEIEEIDIGNSSDVLKKLSLWPDNISKDFRPHTDVGYASTTENTPSEENDPDTYTDSSADYNTHVFHYGFPPFARNDTPSFTESVDIGETTLTSDNDGDASFEAPTMSAALGGQDRKRYHNRSELWPVKRTSEMPGELILGGLMMVHEREDSVICGPVMPQGGIQALETMLYTLDVINADEEKPYTLGAHILDDCDKDTYGLEMAVDFIRGK